MRGIGGARVTGMTKSSHFASNLEPVRGVARGTLVRTPQGMFPIEKLAIGDTVLAQDGRTARIHSPTVAAAHELLRIHFTDNSVVESTRWHRYFELAGDLIAAELMRPGTVARSHDGRIVRVARSERIGGGAVYNLVLERDVSFYANGKLVEAPRAARVIETASLIANA